MQAQQLYTKAIEADPTSAVLWGNRAFAAIRLEEFGGAIADATKALELDEKYAKGFYRRGDASFALGHFKDAVRDFRAAIRLAPGDPDLRRKVRSAAWMPRCCGLQEGCHCCSGTAGSEPGVGLLGGGSR